ncbi:hypothetical protein GCM10010313_52920 [Streptomyces violarus]|nr:hypothetical protein GCM10010313_52920 [Streptomyces violarus]
MHPHECQPWVDTRGVFVGYFGEVATNRTASPVNTVPETMFSQRFTPCQNARRIPGPTAPAPSSPGTDR